MIKLFWLKYCDIYYKNKYFINIANIIIHTQQVYVQVAVKMSEYQT